MMFDKIGECIMVRLSKVTRIRSVSKKRPSAPAVKTGALKETLPNGFKEHKNALTGEVAAKAFIAKVR
jgi:hypothetical protein